MIQASYRRHLLFKRVVKGLINPRQTDRESGIIRKRKAPITVETGPKLVVQTGPLTTKQRIWLLVNEPASSLPAYVLAVVVLLFIVTSCTAFVMETIPKFGSPGDYTEFYGMFPETFRNIEIVCVSVFALEFVIRVLTVATQKVFWADFLNWVDLVSILPFFIERCVVSP